MTLFLCPFSCLQLNKENKTLKRISMLYVAKLGPDIITEEINIDDEESPTDAEVSPGGACDSVQCQQVIKGEHRRGDEVAAAFFFFTRSTNKEYQIKNIKLHCHHSL